MIFLINFTSAINQSNKQRVKEIKNNYGFLPPTAYFRSFLLFCTH